MSSDDIPEIYKNIVQGYIRQYSSREFLITQPTKVTLKLEEIETERYYQHAKFQVELAKSWETVNTPFFLRPTFASNPDFVKQALLNQVQYHDNMYNLVFKYVYDRCLETCNEKTLLVEIGRKHQPVSTDTISTEPFPAETLWAYSRVPEVLLNKLNEWVNSSFQITLSGSGGTMLVHSDDGETNEVPRINEFKLSGGIDSRFDCDTKIMAEKPYGNGPDLKDTQFTVEFSVELTAMGFHPDVFMPDYFTRVKPRPWTGEIVRVFSSNGDSKYCYLAALKCSSPVLESQVNKDNLTLELSSEVFEPFIEFINNSHIAAATNSFKLTVELLFAANKYDVKELQEKLLDLIYVQPLCWFDDTEALIELYLLLEVTRTSEVVLKRVEGIVKLKASSILSSPIFQDLVPTQKSSISSLINTYDTVLDVMSLWSDNKHATRCAKYYEQQEAEMAENARIQAIHKRKPWQLCCDYLNYCNFKTGDGAPAELPDKLIKIEKTFHNRFFYTTKLVME